MRERERVRGGNRDKLIDGQGSRDADIKGTGIKQNQSVFHTENGRKAMRETEEGRESVCVCERERGEKE